MANAIGSVPLLQDRAHRAFLASLKRSIETLSKGADSSGSDSSSIANSLSALTARVGVLENSLEPTVGVTDDGYLHAALGDAVMKYDLLAALGGGLADASVTDITHVERVIGIALDAGAAGDSVRVATDGQMVENPNWTWTPGVLWAGEAGMLSQDAGTGVFWQPVAIAVSPTAIIVLVGTPTVRFTAMFRALSSEPDGIIREIALIASGVENDSSIAGATVKEALENLVAGTGTGPDYVSQFLFLGA